MQRPLSGLGIEYRVVSLYSRDRSQREAKLRFDVGQGTQDLGFRSEVDVLFTAVASAEVVLRVRDERDEPTTASFVFASRRSAEWCLKGVDVCWSQKKRFIAAGEMKDAEAAYEHARAAYRRIVAESE